MRSNDPVRVVDLVRVDGAGRRRESDRLAVERPLEVRLHGTSFSVIMRTPGDEAALAVGFLFSEGVIRSARDLAAVDVDDTGDIVDVVLSPERAPALELLLDGRRQVTTNSSCGMCGRVSIDSIEVEGPPLAVTWRVPSSAIPPLPAALRRAQRTFAETGGLHAAGFFDLAGRLERSAEDVGRHNAVDKLVGHMVRAGRVPLDQYMLVVSGRLSFEIVQKAWLAGIPLVAAVSAPSSLAVDLAERSGMTLLGFVRDGRFNIYAGADRLT